MLANSDRPLTHQLQLNGQNDKIRKLNQKVARQDKRAAAQDQKIAQQNQTIVQQDQKIAEQGHTLVEQGRTIDEQGQQLQRQQDATDNLREEGQAVIRDNNQKREEMKLEMQDMKGQLAFLTQMVVMQTNQRASAATPLSLEQSTSSDTKAITMGRSTTED
jgi:hypothetical protein